MPEKLSTYRPSRSQNNFVNIRAPSVLTTGTGKQSSNMLLDQRTYKRLVRLQQCSNTKENKNGIAAVCTINRSALTLKIAVFRVP